MVGGGEEVSRASGVAVSSAREESTWEMAVKVVSMAREATSEGGGADVASTAIGAKLDVGKVEVDSEEVTMAEVAASEVRVGAVSVAVVAGVLDAVVVGFLEAMSSRTFSMRSGLA